MNLEGLTILVLADKDRRNIAAAGNPTKPQLTAIPPDGPFVKRRLAHLAMIFKCSAPFVGFQPPIACLATACFGGTTFSARPGC